MELRVYGVLGSSQVGPLATPVEGVYTLVALAVQRTYLFALAMLTAVFVLLYPYWGAEGMCDSGS